MRRQVRSPQQFLLLWRHFMQEHGLDASVPLFNRAPLDLSRVSWVRPVAELKAAAWLPSVCEGSTLPAGSISRVLLAARLQLFRLVQRLGGFQEVIRTKGWVSG